MNEPAPRSASTDPGLCPLCSRGNSCAMAAERVGGVARAQPCWCMSLAGPPQEARTAGEAEGTPVSASFAPGVLDRIPAAARGLACICQHCARGESGSA